MNCTPITTYFFSAFLPEVDFDFSADVEDFSSFFEADSSFEAPSFLEAASSFDLESPFDGDAEAEGFFG